MNTLKKEMNSMGPEKALFNAVVCYLVKEDKVLLGLKTQKIGKGCWNGYGGGIEEGETPRKATVREFMEETGGVVIDPVHLEKIGIGHFRNTKSDGESFICVVHFYIAHKWNGEVKESIEMVTPTWFSINDLPLHRMMPTDSAWLPQAFEGKKIIVRAHLGPYQKELLGPVELEYVEVFSD